MSQLFSIDLIESYWINRREDDPDDLCLHGNLKVTIGSSKFYYENATVSASALYFMKSIYENHMMNERLQFIPCCGFSMFKKDNCNEVDIIGCPNGIDWSVYHVEDCVKIVTASDDSMLIDKEIYKNEIFKFSDKVENIYKKSTPKNIPKDEIEAEGYQTFWKEWRQLRGKFN